MKKALFTFAILLIITTIFVVSQAEAQEELKLLTYYPAPYGIYQQVVIKQENNAGFTDLLILYQNFDTTDPWNEYGPRIVFRGDYTSTNEWDLAYIEGTRTDGQGLRGGLTFFTRPDNTTDPQRRMFIDRYGRTTMYVQDDSNEVDLLSFERITPSPADNDTYHLVFKHQNDNSDQEELARISLIATDVSAGTPEAALAIGMGTGSGGWDEKMRITTAGNVGIGITNPWGVLHVQAPTLPGSYGTIILDGGLAYTTQNGSDISLKAQDGGTMVGSNTNGGNINLAPGAGFGTGSTGGVAIGPTYFNPVGLLHVKDSGGSPEIIIDCETPTPGVSKPKLRIASSPGGGVEGGMYFHPSESSLKIYSTATGNDSGTGIGSGIITLITNGRVGIGTTDPATDLHIQSKADTDASIRLYAPSNTAQTNTSLIFHSVTGSGASKVASIRNDASTGIIIGRGTPPDSTLTVTCPISGSGNVGIRTSTPSKALEVAGNALVQGTQGFDASGEQAQLSLGSDHFNITAEYGYGIRFNAYSKPNILTLEEDGEVRANGYLIADNGGKLFDIEHPNPEKAKQGWRLRHASVESPTRGDNLYRWKIEVIDNQTDIKLPDYYKFLNENTQIWVSPKNHFGRAYGEINKDSETITITADTPGTYNVLVIGTRKDKFAKKFDEKSVEYKDTNKHSNRE